MSYSESVVLVLAYSLALAAAVASPSIRSASSVSTNGIGGWKNYTLNFHSRLFYLTVILTNIHVHIIQEFYSELYSENK